MLFSEPAFLFAFLPLLLALYFLPGMAPVRNGLLLLFSLVFYAWGEKYFVIMMLVSVAFNYAMGLWVDRDLRRAAARGRKSGGRLAITLTVVGNLAMLGVYKYADWFVHTINAAIVPLGLSPIEAPGIRLPVGISFFTFQAMSYVIDVYRREADVQRNPLNIGLYIALFPQLIAGPIVRYKDVAAQIVHRVISRAEFAMGIRRFILGLGKKMIIADTCAYVADHIFGSMSASPPIEGVPLQYMTAGLAWLAVICYTLQIYFDFSAYSDMAIGLGHMFGFRFLENFNYPYISRSVTEFWRRWHMSLSTWFRDYLYIPLGGNRGSPLRTYRNLFIVFFLCGLWHGASWTFVIWGMYHGVFLILERLGFGGVLSRSPRILRHLYLMLIVIVGWVFFRAESLPQALGMLKAMVGFGGTAAGAGVWYRPGMYVDIWVIIAIALGAIASAPVLPLLLHWYERTLATLRGAARAAMESSALVLGMIVLAVVFSIAALLAAAGSYSPFIYYRF